MLETDLFWTFITILSTVIEWIVLRFLLEEISKLKKSKIQLNMSLLIASIIVLILTNKEFNINIKFFICIMITYFIYTYNYEVDMLKGIFISLLYWLMLIGFDSIGSVSYTHLDVYKRQDIDKQDIIKLTFTPVMGGKMDKSEKILKAIKLSKEITSPYKRDMESILYAFANKFLRCV